MTVRAEGTPLRYKPWENHLEKVSCEELADGEKKLHVSVEPLELCVIVFVKEEKELQTFAIRENGAALGTLLARIVEFSVTMGCLRMPSERKKCKWRG